MLIAGFLVFKYIAVILYLLLLFVKNHHSENDGMLLSFTASGWFLSMLRNAFGVSDISILTKII